MSTPLNHQCVGKHIFPLCTHLEALICLEFGFKMKKKGKAEKVVRLPFTGFRLGIFCITLIRSEVVQENVHKVWSCTRKYSSQLFAFIFRGCPFFPLWSYIAVQHVTSDQHKLNIVFSPSFQCCIFLFFWGWDIGTLRCHRQWLQRLAHPVVETAIVSHACVWIYLRSVSVVVCGIHVLHKRHWSYHSSTHDI